MFLDAHTPIHLRLAQKVTSQKAKAGDHIPFQVSDDVTVGHLVVIPRGTIAWGRISRARPSEIMMQRGQLAVELNSVAALTGQEVSLGAAEEAAEGQRPMIGGAGILSPFFLPFQLLQPGGKAEIPKGTTLTALVKSRVTLDQTRLIAENRALEERLKSLAQRAQGKAIVSIYGVCLHNLQTCHRRYLVRLDGKDLVDLNWNHFVTLQLEPGEHTITAEDAELKLQAEKGSEYYVKVREVVHASWTSKATIKLLLESVSLEEGEAEKYPLKMSSHHDIKNRAIVITESLVYPPTRQ